MVFTVSIKLQSVTVKMFLVFPIRTGMDLTLASLRSSSSWPGPCPSLLHRARPPPRDGMTVVRKTKHWSAAPHSTCPETRSNTCTSAPARGPERSSKHCWGSSPSWTIRPSSHCSNAANNRIKVRRPLIVLLTSSLTGNHKHTGNNSYHLSLFSVLKEVSRWRTPAFPVPVCWTQRESPQFSP